MQSDRLQYRKRTLACRRTIQICILIVAALVGSACSEELELLSPDANQVTVYTSFSEEQSEEYLKDFKKKHSDILLQVIHDETLPLTDRLLDEAQGTQADVIWGLAATSMSLMEWNYLLTTYQPEGSERIAPLFRDESDPPYWTPISARSLVLCVNSGVLRQKGLTRPVAWADLISPDYAGLLVMPNPGNTSVGYLLISAILQLQGETAGWEFLERLHQNTGHYVASSTQVCPLVASGTYAIGIAYDNLAVEQMTSSNPVEIIYPAEKTAWEVEVNALVRKDVVKPTAKRFLDWAISDSAMRQYARNRSIVTVDLNLTAQEGFPADPLIHLLDQDTPWIAANRMRVQREWLAAFGGSTHTSQE